MSAVFLTGIGTEVGKTVASAILVEAFKANYWKPVQCGDLENSDSMKVKKWISNPLTRIYPERFRLKAPMSPHAAADLEKISIEIKDFHLPESSSPLLVEGAGGLMVPLNEKHCMIDLIDHLNLPVILVSQHYLGSINHTILSVNALKNRKIRLLGILFNGYPKASTESVIVAHTGVKILGRIEPLPKVDQSTIAEAARLMSTDLTDPIFSLTSI